MILAHPPCHERKERQPEQQMEVGPENEARHLFRRLQHVVMVVPVNAEVDEAQNIAEENGKQRPQRREVLAERDSELEHHDRDDDREHAIAERFQTPLRHYQPAFISDRASCRPRAAQSTRQCASPASPLASPYESTPRSHAGTWVTTPERTARRRRSS